MKEYRFVEANCSSDLGERVNELAAQGYEVVQMSQSEDEHAIHYLACLARTTE